MSITAQSVKVLRRLTEIASGESPQLSEVACTVPCSLAVLRHEVDRLNLYLPPRMQVSVRAGRIEHAPSYREFRGFLRDLPLGAYAPDPYERLRLCLVEAVLGEKLNMARLYAELGISEATKKADARELRAWAEAHGFETRVLPRRGLELCGEEFRLRIAATMAVMPLVELEADSSLVVRRANTPFDTRTVRRLIGLYDESPEFWGLCLEELLNAFGRDLSGMSKKFLLIYLIVSSQRIDNHPILDAPHSPIKVVDARLFGTAREDAALNTVVSMLDFEPPLDVPQDGALSKAVQGFLAHVNTVARGFAWTNEAELSVYNYVYRQGLRKHWGVSFPDKMIRGTKGRLPELYEASVTGCKPIEQALEVTFDDEQHTTLALTLAMWQNRQQKVGVETRRIAVATNSSKERVGYFTERLRCEVDVEVVGVFDRSKLGALVDARPDTVIVFSERMAGVVAETGLKPILLSFYLEHADVERLVAEGFSSMRKHVDAEEVVRQVQGLAPDEAAAYLRAAYGGLFV